MKYKSTGQSHLNLLNLKQKENIIKKEKNHLRLGQNRLLGLSQYVTSRPKWRGARLGISGLADAPSLLL